MNKFNTFPSGIWKSGLVKSMVKIVTIQSRSCRLRSVSRIPWSYACTYKLRNQIRSNVYIEIPFKDAFSPAEGDRSEAAGVSVKSFHSYMTKKEEMEHPSDALKPRPGESYVYTTERVWTGKAPSEEHDVSLGNWWQSSLRLALHWGGL